MFIVYDVGLEMMLAMLFWSAVANFIFDGKEWKLKALKKAEIFPVCFWSSVGMPSKETQWIPDIAQVFSHVKGGSQKYVSSVIACVHLNVGG